MVLVEKMKRRRRNTETETERIDANPGAIVVVVKNPVPNARHVEKIEE